MDVNIPGCPPITGDHPIVIIGPNGVGKTRLGVAITQTNNAERVAALRNVEIPNIPMQRFKEASAQVTNALKEGLAQHWRQSFELQNLLSAIVAEDREAAVAYREQAQKVPPIVPDSTLTNTRLRQIVNIWNRHFPGRKIQMNYDPTVERKVNDDTFSYSISQMSEGERTALYLAARVVSCNKDILVVDEPETFFHPVLARSLWNDLEGAAPDVRFIYITHDIPFALSRRGQFVIARSEIAAELLPITSALPSDVTAQVLGAASFSVLASRLIFCEGDSASWDNQFLTAWHDCPKTAVIAVGGCGEVQKCVSAFRLNKVASGVEAFGYIDRNGWPDSELESDPNIKAHPVSEIEGFVCLESIFMALAKYASIPQADAAKRYIEFLEIAKNGFKDVTLNKVILNRAKQRVETERLGLLNPIKPDSDIATVRDNFKGAMPKEGWDKYLAAVFDDEERRSTTSLNADAGQFIRDFPAESYYSHAAAKLDVKSDALIRTIREALLLSDEEADKNERLKLLRDAIVSTLEASMWPRRI